MSSQDAYIIEMMNKRQNDRDIIDGLRDNYMMSESDARAKLSTLLSSLQTQQVSRFRGGNIRIKNNPGFLTKITKGAFNNIITIEIANINNTLFLPALHIYIDSIIRIYQEPGTTDIPYDKIMELCAGVGRVSTPSSASAAAAATATATATATAAVEDIGTQPKSAIDSFASDSRPEAILSDVRQSDKEEPIDLMDEIVHVPVASSSSASALASASASAGVGASAAPLVFGFEMESSTKEEDIDLFDLLQDDDEDDGDGDGDGGDSAQGGGGGGGGAAAVVKKGLAPRDAPASALDEDLSDITGMELANPNPFSKRIQERDPIIHLNEDVGKFNAYSRSCPWNVRRQPVILTSEEKARIDREHPNSYSHSITYGSDQSKQYHYICPRYWSLKHNTSLTEEEVKSGKYGSVIPQKAKKVPAGANIFEFTDDKYHKDDKGNYKQHYPGFLKKDAHPNGLCVPCCFAQWDKPSQTSRRQECETKQHEVLRTETTVAAAEATAAADTPAPVSEAETPIAAPALPPAPVETVKINEMKDDRILSSDKFPLENNRWGYLPVQVQKFLFSDSRNCQVSLKNTAIKKDTPCLLRRGVETNNHQSFVSAMAYYYKESIGVEKTTASTTTTSTVTTKKRIPMSMAAVAAGAAVDAGAAGTGLSLKDRIAKTITESIQKQTAQIAMSIEEPASEAIEHESHSDDETPVAMTPRPSAAAATPRPGAAAATPRPGAAAATPRPSAPAPAPVESATVPTIREMRNIIIRSLDIDRFVTLQNGTLTDVFYNPNKEVRDTSKYNTISRSLPKETFTRICNAYENFIAYLDDDASIIDHTYLWDIVSRPNEKLFKNGNNIILIHIPDDDITNNVQVICPTNAYSGEVFDVNRKTIILMKRDTYYEPIYLFESKSNGKFSVLGRFAIKSKTLMPKIKYIIENIRDLYFSYCRLHASQPREYKYKMNQPAPVIAKMVKDAGFEITAQVLNFNGKVIGLQISQTIATTRLNPSAIVKKTQTQKTWKGVIPTAVSAPLTTSSSAPPKMILMDDNDELWTMSYRETVDFLDTVAAHVKKVTKKDIYCRTKVKVVEDGLVVGVITETNQFLQVNVNKDPQLNQDDGIPTITESNHLVADKEIATTAASGDAAVDKTRERYVRNIRLETNFYNVFRNTARNILNRPNNKKIKDDIEKIIASPFMIYQNKLSQIIAHMKRMLGKYVAFIKYSKDTLKMVGEISGCITSDDETCGKKSYCLKESGGFCKLLLPQRNLMYPDIDNEIAYFGKLSDEMIRYERVKLFMFEPTKYLSFQDKKYDLRDDEIILLETFITQEYFENMEPADANPYVFQTNFYTVAPSNAGSRGIQSYDPVYRKEYVDKYLELEAGGGGDGPDAKKAAVAASAAASEAIVGASFHINEVNHVLDFCRQVSKRKITEKIRQKFFPNADTFEILFSNESNECSFDVILTILRCVAQSASKCPSGHHCIRQKQQAFAFKGAAEGESDICEKCRTTIGHDQTEFGCRQCNYFICEHCQYQHVDELAEMTIPKLKNILVNEYGKLSEMGLDKKLTMLLNGYGMKKYADIVNEGRATLPQIIQSENYFLTNVDIWIIALYFKIPIVFISQSLLSENGKSMMVLYGDDLTESYFFVHPFTITQDVPSRYGLFEVKIPGEGEPVSLLKIPHEFMSQELRENIEGDDDARLLLEEYIRTFKLGNIKHKTRVFTMPVAPPAETTEMPKIASLFQ
jgi:hypothetical protein